MKNIFCTFLFFLIPILAHSQQGIDLTVINETKEPLMGATAVLLSQPDSTMVAFGITDEKGRCTLDKVEAGKYILQLSYVGYNNHSESIEVKKGENNNLSKNITLTASSELLNEVTIKAEHIPMGIIGDTISYNAAAFKTRQGASVEDLLKKLPGIEVDRNGNIKAQGEDIEKVLVDGKAFFGDDPLMATKNLEAEAVDKVQVFDKASEIAAFTGIADGEDQKTINLKLKESHKSGGFGKVEAEGGTEDTWKGKVNYNRFSPTMQAAVLVSGNNINEQSFSINEYIRFMGGLGNAIASGQFSFDDNQNNGEGVHTNYSIGTNLNYDFSDKLKLLSNYFYIDNTLNIAKTTKGEHFNQAFNYTSIDTINKDYNTKSHLLNTKLKYKLNSQTEFVFKNNLNGNFNINSNQSQTEFLHLNNTSSQSSSNQLLQSNLWTYESQFQFRQKFLKKGRNMISTVSYDNNSIVESNDVLNTFLMSSSASEVHQFQDYHNRQNKIFSTLDYTEPLGNKTYLGLKYSYNLNTESPSKDFYDRMPNGILTLNSTLSSLFQKHYSYHSPGFKIKKNTKKVKTNVGANIQFTKLRGIVGLDEERIEKSFSHLLPSLTLDVDIGRGKDLKLNYSTHITAPTLRQLLPIQDNSNPNILIKGNPSLIPIYSHTLGASYNMFNQFDFISFFANARINYAKNQIVNQVSIDEHFLQIVSPINTDKFLSAHGYLSYSRPIRLIKANIEFTGNINYANYTSFLNTIENQVSENTINFSTTLRNRNTDVVSVSAGFRIAHNLRTYSVAEGFNQQFFNYDWFVEIDFYLSESLSLTTEFDYKRFANVFFSKRQSFALWNASINQSFREGKYSIYIKAHDILNQNIGLRRSSTSNGLQESSYNTLGRYIMLGVSMKIK